MLKSNESKEMYLEIMYDLYLQNVDIHSVDIAHKLGYSKPSVARAMVNLKNEDYITKVPYGAINLTSKGLEAAKLIKNRHVYLTKFLAISLDINEDLAEKDACRIEHIISCETMEAVRNYVHAHSNEKEITICY